MRLVLTAVCAAVVVSAGCAVGYRSTAGGATAPGAAGQGVTRSIKFADEGLLLSRLGLSLASVGVAAGSIENAQVKTETSTVGDRTVVRQERSATIHSGPAEAGMKLANAATDPKSKLSGLSGGLASRLEIAAQTLGGDTSGWQYELGFNLRKLFRLGPVGAMARVYSGLGYGNFTTHDRAQSRVDRGPPMFGDAEYGFGGIYTRVGLSIVKPPRSIKDLFATETFLVASANARGPSYVAIGQRLQWSVTYIEVEMQRSGEAADPATYCIELGLGFF